MDVCWDVHHDTYLDIWVGRVIIIKCQDNNLSCCSTNLVIPLVFVTIAFFRFYFRFSVLWLLYYTCSCPAFPLIFYSTSLLLLSSYIIHVPCFISITVYLLVPACWCSRHSFSMHVYNSDLSSIYNSSEYKFHSVEVVLYYFKYL